MNVNTIKEINNIEIDLVSGGVGGIEAVGAKDIIIGSIAVGATRAIAYAIETQVTMNCPDEYRSFIVTGINKGVSILLASSLVLIPIAYAINAAKRNQA